MKVYINKITGLDDAMVSLLMSKRSWTRELETDIREQVAKSVTDTGYVLNPTKDFCMWMDKLIKYGVEYGHTTLLRFIDISITVEGIHRAGQDDWDAHVARMDNRIVRSSTRLANFEDGEISAWYKHKIKYPFQVLEALGMNIPKEAVIDGVTYIKTDFGYIRADLATDKDVKRGLYPEAIPSNFICKIQYPELCHILQHRDSNGSANPEVQDLADLIKTGLRDFNKWLGLNVWNVMMQPAGHLAKKELEQKHKDNKIIAERNLKLTRELKELQERDEILTALEEQGVDNWDGYEYALQSINKEEEE